MNQLEQISESQIREIVTDFYQLAFDDVMIGHFFFNFEKTHLISQQSKFLIGLFGGPKRYQGRKLDQVHQGLKVKNVHFNRRQVLMRGVLEKHLSETSLIEKWLAKEGSFRHLVVNDTNACR